MNLRRKPLVVVVLAAAYCLPGCGPGKDIATPETVQSEGLDQLWEVYQLAAKQKKQPPKQASDLNAFRRAAPGAVQKVAAGDFVVVWGIPPAAAGEPARLLAYTKDAPTQGGYMLLSDGTVKKCSVEEFNAAKAGS
jgi:hypothetical protein